MQHAEAKLVAKNVAEPYTCIDIYIKPSTFMGNGVNTVSQIYQIYHEKGMTLLLRTSYSVNGAKFGELKASVLRKLCKVKHTGN